MNKSIFSYTVTRSFPYRWFPWAVLVGGICATGLLTVFSLAANGYELYTVYTSDPNSTISYSDKTWFERPPWSWTTKISPTCQAQIITLGARKSPFFNFPIYLICVTEIYTTNHQFKYTVDELRAPINETEVPTTSLDVSWISSASYNNDYLHDCTLSSLTLNATDGGPYFQDQVICTIYNGSIPISITLSTEMISPFLSYYQISRPNSSIELGLNIIAWYEYAILNFTGPFNGSWTKLEPDTFPTDIFAVVGLIEDDGEMYFFYLNATDVVPWSSTFGDITVLSTESESTADENFEDPYINNTIYLDGFAKLCHSLILTDLGQSSEANILASPQRSLDFMNKSILFSLETPDRTYEWSWFAMLGFQGDGQSSPPSGVNEFYQWANMSLPQVQPAAFDMQYLCQVPRLKAAGSLFVSVVVPVFVFLQIIWTVFSWTTAYFLERQRPDTQYCVGCAKAVALGQLDLDTESNGSSELKLKQSGGAHSAYATTLEPTPTWSHGIDDGQGIDGIRPAPIETPLVWSDSITAETIETASLRSISSVRRTNEPNPYFLLTDP